MRLPGVPLLAARERLWLTIRPAHGGHVVLESGVHFPSQEFLWGLGRVASLSVPRREAVSVMECPPDALTYGQEPGGWA